jgi:hypothetical protein
MVPHQAAIVGVPAILPTHREAAGDSLATIIAIVKSIDDNCRQLQNHG